MNWKPNWAVPGILAAVSVSATACAQTGGYVPYKAESGGGICDTPASPTASNPRIVIDSDGTQPFVVTSILVRTGPQAQGAEGYAFFAIANVFIDNARFDTPTGNLTAPLFGSGVNEAADLMGMPVILSRTSDEKGGSFPHQIVADGQGSNDIMVTLFCRADNYPLDVGAVLVAGWKPAADTVTVSYLPGN